MQGGCEKRMPPDGGPDLPHATLPQQLIAQVACDPLVVFKVKPPPLRSFLVLLHHTPMNPLHR